MLVQIRLWSLQDKRNTEIFTISNKNRMRFPRLVFFCFLLSGLKPLSLRIFFVFTWTWSILCTTDLTALRIASDSFPDQIHPVNCRKIGPRGGREVLHNYLIQGLCQNSWRQGIFINLGLILQRLSALGCGTSCKSLGTFELILRKSNDFVFVDISFSVLFSVFKIMPLTFLIMCFNIQPYI